MKITKLWIPLLVACLAGAGCDEDTESQTDAGAADAGTVDAGGSADGGSGVDSGTSDTDTGGTQMDAGGSDVNPGEGREYRIGGAVSGLRGEGLSLSLNGEQGLRVSEDGPFFFDGGLRMGETYRVEIETQPTNPAQTCAVVGGSGTVDRAEITSIEVTCAEDSRSFVVGGDVRNLIGEGLTLSIGGRETVALAPGATSFEFPPVPDGTAWTVRVVNQPTDPDQVCTSDGRERTVRGADDRSATVTCTEVGYPVAGTVTGLTGAGLTLSLNGDELLEVGMRTEDFEFATLLNDGDRYLVSVETQPERQACVVANGFGQLDAARPPQVEVECGSDDFEPITGTVSGLVGAPLIIGVDGRADIEVSENGPFEIPNAARSGDAFAVTVAAVPEGEPQVCRVFDGSGRMRDGGISGVEVVCTAGEVVPVYPESGLSILGQAENDGTSPFDASDTPCVAADIASSRSASCLRTGLMRSVPIPGAASCDGLRASDTLGALEWVCRDEAGVEFVSVGFRDGAGIASLIDFDARDWADIGVSVTDDDGFTLVETTPANNWWTNNVALGASVGAFDWQVVPAGTVALIVNPVAPSNFSVPAGTAYVVDPDLLLEGSGSCGGSLVNLDARSWLEGRFDASGCSDAEYGVNVSPTGLFSTLRNVEVTGASTGIRSQTSYVTIEGARVRDFENTGIELTSAGVTVDGLDVANSTAPTAVGLRARQSSHVLRDIRIQNLQGVGILLDDVIDSVVSDVLVSSVDGNAIELRGDCGTTVITRATVARSSSQVLFFTDSTRSDIVVERLVNFHSGEVQLIPAVGFTRFEGRDLHLDPFAGGALAIGGNGEDMNFIGQLRSGTGADTCRFIGPPVDSNVYPDCIGTPTGLEISRDFQLEGRFVGLVGSDAVNSTALTGGVASLVADWFGFENPYRAWGIAVDGEGTLGDLGSCDGECGIYDWSMIAEHAGVYDDLSEDSSRVVRWVSAGADTTAECDERIPGSTYNRGVGLCESTYLPNLAEIVGDTIGNENGLCEADERCTTAFNAGAYQGHGELIRIGELGSDAGAFAGVVLYEWSESGY